MKAAIISDIHSNLEALEAVFADLERFQIDHLFCLGDVVGYGPDPIAVIEILEKIKTPKTFIWGNHDQSLFSDKVLHELNPEAGRVIEWSRQFFGEKEKAFFNSFLLQHLDANLGICAFHSTLENDNDYLLFPKQIQEYLEKKQKLLGRPCLFLGGHTHIRTLISPEQAYILSHDFHRSYQKVLADNTSYFFNPGSVGQPRGGFGLEASYAIWDNEQRLIKSILVPYDWKKTQNKIRLLGLPEFFALRLQKGI